MRSGCVTYSHSYQAATSWQDRGSKVIAWDQTDDDIGIRIPNHPFLRAVLHKTAKPLAATSANLSGNTPQFSEGVNFTDLVFEPGFWVKGGHEHGVPSTVIQLREEKIVMLREGAIPLESVREILRSR